MRSGTLHTEQSGRSRTLQMHTTYAAPHPWTTRLREDRDLALDSLLLRNGVALDVGRPVRILGAIEFDGE